jgi:citrate synthase
MAEDKPIVNTGLRGVTVASTKISDVDGGAGKLIYRGYLITDLASRTSFEEVAYLLLYEELPDNDQLKNFKTLINPQRHLPPAVITALKACPADALPMDILQAGVSLLAQHDADTKEQSLEASQRMAIRLIASMPTLLAAWGRIRKGLEPVAPVDDLNLAANFLYMLTGEVPKPDVAQYFDVCLVLHAEHSFNASTFSARQVASTRAHMYAAVSAAIGSLSGELHGGANVRVMQMLLKIGSVDAVDTFVEEILDSGKLIMGLGHAVYQTDDPRAHIIAPMAKDMGQRTGQPQWYEIAKVLEKKGKAAFLTRKKREIYVNVDFYSAPLYYAMGIEVDLFSPVFAISRVAGWAAHVLEEQYAQAAPKPMLYRPGAEYVGEYCGPDECAYVPIDER